MTKQVQRRRGTDTQHTSFTGAEGELSVNTTNKSVHVHDGSTAGGIEAARADLGNVSDADLNSALTGNTLSSLTITSADINGGTIDGTVIGGSSAAAVTATTLTATSSATLQHSASTKLATTSTGVDVTGSVTADGLTVDSTSNLAASVSNTTDTAAYHGLKINTANTSSLTYPLYVRSNNLNRLVVQGNGDISFYEDTGTTPKFFWDASREQLALGTNTAVKRLTLSLGNDDGISFGDRSESGDFGIGLTGGGSFIGNTASIVFNMDGDNTGGITYSTNNDPHIFTVSDTERMRIDSSGNVGIGTDSPSTTFVVKSPSAAGQLRIDSDGGAGRIHSNGDLQFYTNSTDYSIQFKAPNDGSEHMRIDSSGNVGIGTSSPSVPLHVVNASTPRMYLGADASKYAGLVYTAGGTFGSVAIRGQGNDTGTVLHVDRDNSQVRFDTSGSERMRIDASGSLLVGKTSDALGTTGTAILGGSLEGLIESTSADNRAMTLNRLTSDGDILQFRKDNSTVGSISVSDGDRLNINSGSMGLKLYDNTMAILPSNGSGLNSDNTHDLGGSTVRFDDLYATNGTIQTSDRNEKQDIDVLSDAETRVAQACKGLLRKFRWQDAVAEKGDDARIHFGIIAQDLQDAFAAEGLDAGRYAMFISSTWWETQTDVPAVAAVEAVEATYDEDGNELTPAVEAVEAKEAYTRTDTYETLEEAPEGATERTRLGVRYPELLAFIIAAI